MARVLRPGSDENDFVEMLTKDVPVEIKKVRGGAQSAVGVGEVKRGYLTAPLVAGRAAEFRESDQGHTTEVQKVDVDTHGRIAFETATSVYTLLSHAPDHRQKSLLYLRRGYLDFDEKMPDGFYDGGRYMAFEEKGDGSLQPVTPSNREVITTDRRTDPGLQKKLDLAEKMLTTVTDPKQRVLLLAQFVSNVLGGIQVVNTSKALDVCENELEEWKKQYSNVLQLGYLNHGLCRHRAILFKYLADRLGIRSRLIRGDATGAHIWNTVDIGGELLVVDVMNNPFQLFRPDDPAVNYYRRKDGEDKTTGTVGAGSIPMK